MAHFTTNVFRDDPRLMKTDEIHYIDVNSLYPSVMATEPIKGAPPTKHQYLQRPKRFSFPNYTEYVYQFRLYSLYRIVEFALADVLVYGYFGVRSPISGDIFYPTSWKQESEGDPPLWVWGFEIRALAFLFTEGVESSIRVSEIWGSDG